MTDKKTLDQYLEGEPSELKVHAAKFCDLGRLVASFEPNKSKTFKKIVSAIAKYLFDGYLKGTAPPVINVGLESKDRKSPFTQEEGQKIIENAFNTILPAYDYIFTAYRDMATITKYHIKLFGAYRIGLRGDIAEYNRDFERRLELLSASRWN